MNKRGAKSRQINTYTRTAVPQHHIVFSEKNVDSTNVLLHMHSGATALHPNDEQTKLDNRTLKNVQRCNRVEIGKWHMKAKQQLGKLQRMTKVMACKIAVLKLHMQRQR